MQVLEHVAGYLGLDATLIRERNFMHPKEIPHPYPVTEPQQSSVSKPYVKADHQNCNGKAESLQTHTQTSQRKGGSTNAEGDEQVAKDLHGRKKDAAFPDVVCGRFQLRAADADDPGSVNNPEGR